MEFKPRGGIRPQGVTLRSRGQALEECAAHGKQLSETAPDTIRARLTVVVKGKQPCAWLLKVASND